MLSKMPWRVWNEWVQYSALEPWGDLRADLRMGILASVMANAWGGSKGRKLTPIDFMPRFEEEEARRMPEPSKKASTPEAMLALVKILNADVGGTEVHLGSN